MATMGSEDEEAADTYDGPDVVRNNIAAGKLFFVNPNNDRRYSCTASVVNTRSGDVIATAGHCLFTGRNGVPDWTYYTDFEFLPDWESSGGPYGGWVGYRVRVTWEWSQLGNGQPFNSLNAQGYENDYGVLKLFAGGHNDAPVQQIVGANGYYISSSLNYYMTQFGYPSDTPNVMRQCSAETGTWIDSGMTYQSACPLRPGSSGGPWLYDYEHTYERLGLIRAVTSLAVCSERNSAGDCVRYSANVGAPLRAEFTSLLTSVQA